MKVFSGAYWDKGLRSVNQDSIALQQAMTDRGRVLLAVVSDGIGGLAEGEIASGYLTERLTENFYGQTMSLIGRGKGWKELKKCLLRCLYDSNEGLKDYGEGKEIKLGATVSLLLVWKKRYLLMHLGDSRIYLHCGGRFGRKQIRLLTQDHCAKGGINRCIGSFPFHYPDIKTGRIYGKKGFLLCTDGFYRKMNREAFEALAPDEIGNEDQIYRRLKEIAAASLKKGEQDNMSAVYAVVC